MAGGQPFVTMDMAEAINKCGLKPSALVFENCAKCDSRVGLHCSDCQIQVTGCICSEIERFGNAEAVKRAIDRWGEQEARKRLERAGIWMPPEKLN